MPLVSFRTSLIVKGGKDAVKAAEGDSWLLLQLKRLSTTFQLTLSVQPKAGVSSQRLDRLTRRSWRRVGRLVNTPTVRLKSVENRLIRTKVAAAEPGAKVDNILAATGQRRRGPIYYGSGIR